MIKIKTNGKFKLAFLLSLILLSLSSYAAQDFIIENRTSALFVVNGTTGNIFMAPSFGKVGIGTVSPGVSLTVIGNVSFSGNLSVGGNLSVDGNTLFVDSLGNNVGIGTTGPQNTLDIIGAVTVSKGLNASNLNVTGFSITDDSLVTLSDGTKKKIKDIIAGEKVLTLEEKTGKLVPRKVNALLDHGIKPIYEMTTESGRAINTTAEHPYFVKLYSKKLCDKYSGDVWNKEPDVFDGSCTRWVEVSELNEGIAIAVQKLRNNPFDLRNSTSSSVLKTLTKDCFLKCGSLDQIGHLSIDNDKAKYSVSSGSEINLLASSRNDSYLDNGAGLIALFNLPNSSSSSDEESPERNLILDLCSSTSSNNLLGPCSSRDFEKINSFVTPVPIIPVNTTVASTTNSIYLSSGCNFLSFLYMPALTSLANRIASSSVNLDLETILLNSSKSSCSISRLIASPLATSDQFTHWNLSIFAFSSAGTVNDTFAIYASPLCFLNNSNSSSSFTLFSNALLNTSGQFMSLCLPNLSLSSFGNDMVTVGIVDNLLISISLRDYVRILENVQIFKSIENVRHFREFQKSTIFDTFDSDITFEKIKSIKSLPAQHVYDLSIEGTRNFIANDIVAHNTYLATNSGKVGIGKINPATELDVAGGINSSTLNVSGNVFLATQSGNVGIGTTGPVGKLHVYSGASGVVPNSAADDFVYESNDHSGMSILAPDNKVSSIYFGNPANSGVGGFLEWSNNYGVGVGSLRIGTNQANGHIRFETATADEAMRITSDGNVGIGTTSPAHKLSVAGAINASSTIFTPVVNSTQNNLTISSAAGSVIIRLG